METPATTDLRPVVMVIEPEVLVRMTIAEALRDCGYIVIEGIVAEDVWSVLGSGARLNIVFSEVQLAEGEDGFALARRVRQMHPEIDVILTSGIVGAAEKSKDLCKEGPMKKRTAHKMWRHVLNCCSSGAVLHNGNTPKPRFPTAGGRMDSEPSSQQGPERDIVIVMIVEDDFDTRWVAAVYLRDAGFRVLEAGDVKEAMSVLSAGTHVDVVFSDICMPGDFDGKFLAEWIAIHYPAIPVLLTSGAPAYAHISPTGRSWEFIAKPCDPAEVIRRLREMV